MPATKAEPRTYTFSQLGPKGRKAAIEAWREHTRDWGDDGRLEELLNTDLSEFHGITNSKVLYSLGHCQGDGVAFEGNPDIDHWAEHDEELAEKLTALRAWAVLLGVEEPQFYIRISNSDRHYCHWNSMTLELTNDADWPTNNDIVPLDDMASAVEAYLTNAIKDISRALEKTGYAEIEYMDSDECLSEYLSESDHIMFTRHGALL